LASDDEARAWDFGLLHEVHVANDQFGGEPIVVAYDSPSRAATIYDRKVDGRELTFDYKDGALIDKETDSRWNLFTGMGLSGEFEGKQLRRIPGIVSDSAAWHTYHFESTTWSPWATKSDERP
jgi:hypothetical protein